MKDPRVKPAPWVSVRRRDFLRIGGMSALCLGTRSLSEAMPVGLSVERTGQSRAPVLVVLFQRGAADALHMIVPHGDRRYRELRGGLAMDLKTDGLVDLGDGFAMHPAMEPLHDFYREGQLAALLNVGSRDTTRSHFDAQDYMETGTPGIKGTREGWLTRLVQTVASQQGGGTPFTGVALTSQLPRSFAGARDAIAMADFSRLNVRSSLLTERIHAMYVRDRSRAFSTAGDEASAALSLFEDVDPLSLPTREGVTYPRGRLSASFRQLAQLIKSDLGIRIAFLECGGWDTHFGQGTKDGKMARLLAELSSSIAAFMEDVRGSVPLTFLTMTEFGRSVRVNGAGGTDHGHGGALIALGRGVRGGKVHGDWLGLKTNELYEGRDLPVTTDFRDAFAEVASSSLALKGTHEWFPGHNARSVGLMTKG